MLFFWVIFGLKKNLYTIAWQWMVSHCSHDWIQSLTSFCYEGKMKNMLKKFSHFFKIPLFKGLSRWRELDININAVSLNESFKINASLSQCRGIFKSLVANNASKTLNFIKTRDGLLPGLMRQFNNNNLAKIISVFCLW